MFENISNRKVLVTGGSGFLGRYTVKELIAKGALPTVLTRTIPTASSTLREKKINYVGVDLLDAKALEHFLEELRPDIIVHLAGITGSTKNQPDSFENNDYQATANLLNAARKINAAKIVITGTADEYGFQTHPQTETMTAMPVSGYAISKNKAVNHALSLYKKYNTPVVILRPFTIYGAGQPEKMFVSQAVECAVKGTAFEMSKGEQKRDLLFVTDFANAVVKVLEAENIEGEIFNVGSGRAISLRKLAEKIWEIAGADLNLLKIGARHTSDNELHNTEADISKIESFLRWKPETSLEDGLASMIKKRRMNWNEK